jgi:hypothetical protein
MMMKRGLTSSTCIVNGFRHARGSAAMEVRIKAEKSWDDLNLIPAEEKDEFLRRCEEIFDNDAKRLAKTLLLFLPAGTISRLRDILPDKRRCRELEQERIVAFTPVETEDKTGPKKTPMATKEYRMPPPQEPGGRHHAHKRFGRLAAS